MDAKIYKVNNIPADALVVNVDREFVGIILIYKLPNYITARTARGEVEMLRLKVLQVLKCFR